MKILYAAAGEGMGHAIRSEAVINYLKQNHEVIFCGGGKSYQYLNKKVKSYHINCLFIKYKNNKVLGFNTFITNTFKTSKIIKSFFKISKICKSFKPDLIITDFEPISAYYGMISRTKLISIDNLHTISRSKIKYPLKYFSSALNSKIVIPLMIPHAHKRLITTFFYPKIIKKNTEYISPIIRKKIIKLKPKTKDYYLVYQTSDTNDKLIETLKKIDAKFIVYGFHKNEIIGNVILKKNNEDDFFNDIKDCKAIIINGGFTMMTEALYLKKPVLSIPVRKQFEQIINAVYLEKLGYGKFIENFGISEFNSFVKNLDKYKMQLTKNPIKPNDFYKKLDGILKDISGKK